MEESYVTGNNKNKVISSILATAMTSFAGNLDVSKEVTVNASPDTAWKMIGILS
ncbi:MAG: hypothetical protein ACI9FO_000155 [Methylophagaceae bacterium]|jgi:hypothetical protein